MSNFLDDLANVISTYLNERGLYTLKYNGFRSPDSSMLLDIYLYDPYSFIGNCENAVLGNCSLYLKDDNLILDYRIGTQVEYGSDIGYRRGSIQFPLHNEESLQLILNAAQQAFNNALNEIEEYRTKKYGQDDITS